MNAMPPGLREELVASRTLSTSGILFKILRNYQPGGTAEKAETLQALTVAKAAKTPREAVDKIRKWRRHQLRAAELGVVLPDCSILIKALTGMVQQVLAGAPQASFRVNSFRMQCHIDTKPSPTNMESYYQMVLAERMRARGSRNQCLRFDQQRRSWKQELHKMCWWYWTLLHAG